MCWVFYWLAHLICRRLRGSFYCMRFVVGDFLLIVTSLSLKLVCRPDELIAKMSKSKEKKDDHSLTSSYLEEMEVKL